MEVLNMHDVDRIPENAVYVGRPTKWGNPFRLGFHGSRKDIVALYELWLFEQPELLFQLEELRGKDLMCWCAPQQCHADVLLRFANK